MDDHQYSCYITKLKRKKKSWFSLHSCQPSNSETTRVAKGLLKKIKSIGFIVIFNKTISISNLHNHKIPKIRTTSPFFTWYASCDWWRFRYFSGSLYLHVLLQAFFWAIFSCLDFGPCRLFLFFSPFLGVLSFYEVWQGVIDQASECRYSSKGERRHQGN